MSTWTVDAADLVEVMTTCLGRPIPALDALLKVLQGNLPAVLEEVEWPEDRRPKAYQFAGEFLGDPSADDRWPKVLVGAATSTEDFGMGHKDELAIMVTVAWPPQIGRREFQEALDMATAIRGILRHPNFAGSFQDPDDSTVILWGYLYPTGFRIVPPGMQLPYSGWIATFTMEQFPNSQLWKTL